jgi:hypothetical protein
MKGTNNSGDTKYKGCRNKFHTPSLGGFFGSDISWQVPSPMPSYFMPRTSSRKVILSRIIANSFAKQGQVILWLTEWGVWGDSEQPDIFTRYRLSYGETRSLAEAPVHIFNDDGRTALVSCLRIALFSNWGGEVMDVERNLNVTFSHDEWIMYRFAPGHSDVIPYFDKYFGEQCTQQRHSTAE